LSYSVFDHFVSLRKKEFHGIKNSQ